MSLGQAAEGGEKIVVVPLPLVGLGRLAEPARGLDRRFHAGQRPIDVRVLGVGTVQAAVAVTFRKESLRGRIDRGGGLRPQGPDVAKAPFDARPGPGQPGLVAGQPGMARDRPQGDPRFLPVAVDDHDRPVPALEAQQIADAVAGLLRPAQHGDRLHEERPVDDPQSAITGRPDLERRQALLDLAGLVDVADRRIELGLDALVGHLDAAVR